MIPEGRRDRRDEDVEKIMKNLGTTGKMKELPRGENVFYRIQKADRNIFDDASQTGTVHATSLTDSDIQEYG